MPKPVGFGRRKRPAPSRSAWHARRNEPIVRSLQLQAALAEFIAQAADSLHADVLAGQEVPFELASQSGRGRGAASLCTATARSPTRSSPSASPSCAVSTLMPGRGVCSTSFDALDRYLISSGVDRRAIAGPGGAVSRGQRGSADAALLAVCCRRCSTSKPTSTARRSSIRAARRARPRASGGLDVRRRR